jgi:hypothetical protein
MKEMADAVASFVLAVAAVGTVISVGMLAVAAIGMLLTRR